MAQATDGSTTNFTKVDAKEGYHVNGSEVINEDGDYVGGIDVPAGSIDTAEIADDAVTNAKMGLPKMVTYQETFAFGDMVDSGTTGTFELSTSIPEGAVYVQSFLDAVTGFAGDTSAVVTIGDGSDVDRYNTGTPDLFTTADHISAGAVSGTAYHSAAKTPTVIITTAADFTSVSAGQVTVTLMYYQTV